MIGEVPVPVSCIAITIDGTDCIAYPRHIETHISKWANDIDIQRELWSRHCKVSRAGSQDDASLYTISKCSRCLNSLSGSSALRYAGAARLSRSYFGCYLQLSTARILTSAFWRAKGLRFTGPFVTRYNDLALNGRRFGA